MRKGRREECRKKKSGEWKGRGGREQEEREEEKEEKGREGIISLLN
jgi:hypothetical protein